MNSIVYKFNKYYQINGSLFYTFDYFLKAIEERILTNQNKYQIEDINLSSITKEYLKTLLQDNPLNLYIVIPTKYKKNYLQNLEILFRTKYLLWNKEFYTDKKLFETAKNILSIEEYQTLLVKIKICNFAFNQIKLVTPIEFLKKKHQRLLFPNFDSWDELKDTLTEDIKEVLVFQNRKVENIYNIYKANNKEDIIKAFVKYPNAKIKFFYELPPQKLGIKLDNFQEIKYTLKLNFDYYIPKKLFRVSIHPKSVKIITGTPPPNLLLYNKYRKPTTFAQLHKDSNLREPIIFLNTGLLEYYKNPNIFDENNRLVPEARYFNIPISIINREFQKDDSIETRFLEPLKNYTLTKNDIIIQELKKY